MSGGNEIKTYDTQKSTTIFSPCKKGVALTSFLSSYKSPTCFCIPFGQTKHFLGYLLYILSKPAWYLFSWSLFSKIHYISSSWKESSDVWTLKTSKRFMWHTPRDVPPSMAFFSFSHNPGIWRFTLAKRHMGYGIWKVMVSISCYPTLGEKSLLLNCQSYPYSLNILCHISWFPKWNSTAC